MTEVVIRLQNLPLSASSSDVRQFFNGLDIPNGGVRIIGGAKGDCFIVFSNSQDARDALRKDGFWLKDQQIILLPSSQGEMQQIMSIAKGEIPDNSLQQQNPNTEQHGSSFGPPFNFSSDSKRPYDRPEDRPGHSYRDTSVRSDHPHRQQDSFDRDRPSMNNYRKEDHNLPFNRQPDRLRENDRAHNDYRDDFQPRGQFNQASDRGDPRGRHEDTLYGSLNRNERNDNFHPKNSNQGFPMDRDMDRHPGSGRQQNQEEQLPPHRNPPNFSRPFNQDHNRRQPPFDKRQDLGPSQSVDRDLPSNHARGHPGEERDRFSGPRRGHDELERGNDFRGRGFHRGSGRGRNSRFHHQPEHQDHSNQPSNPNYPRGRSGSFNQSENNSNFRMRERDLGNLNQSLPDQWQGSNMQRGDREFEGMNRSSPSDPPPLNMRSSNERPPFNRPNFQDRSFPDRRPSRDSDMRPPQADLPSANLSKPPSVGLLPTPSEPTKTGNSGPIQSLLDVDTRFNAVPTDGPPRPQFHDHGQPQQNRSARSSFPPPSPAEPAFNPNRSNMASGPIPVTDPCTVITQLPPDVKFKQIRGLMATHDILCFNIAIVRGHGPSAPSSAYVLHDDINNTVLALNELQGMKVAGSVIDIKPCLRADYENAVARSKVAPERGEPMHQQQPPFGPGRVEDRFSHKNDPAAPSRDRDMRRDRHNSDSRRHSREDRHPPTGAPRFPGRSRSPDSKRSNSPHRSSRPRSSAHSHPKSSSPPWRTSSRNSDSPRSRSPRHRESSRKRSHSPRGSSREAGNKTNGAARGEVWCAVITGLPPKTSRADLEGFLDGIGYDKESLYLEMNVHKECTGAAYVTLKSKQDQEILISQQRDIHRQSVHVSAINAGQMKDYVDQHRAQLATDTTKPGEFIIQLVGLPYEATPKTIQEFLYPAKIKASDITIVKKNDGTGRCNGNGFAKVYSIEDRDESLKHDRGYIGKRYVCVKVVSNSNMQDFLAKKEQVVETGIQIKNPEIERTVNVSNLRYDIKAEDVEAFFKEFSPEIGSTKFIMANGMPTGRATIRLKSGELAQKAVDKLGKRELAGRSVILSQAY